MDRKYLCQSLLSIIFAFIFEYVVVSVLALVIDRLVPESSGSLQEFSSKGRVPQSESNKNYVSLLFRK